MDSSIIIASISFFSSAIAAVLAYSLNKRAQRENEMRQMKIAAYNNYITALAEMAQNPQNAVLCKQYAIVSNTVFLVASNKAILAIKDFNDYIQQQDEGYSISKQDELITNIYRELRADLRLYKKSNENLENIKLFTGGARK